MLHVFSKNVAKLMVEGSNKYGKFLDFIVEK